MNVLEMVHDFSATWFGALGAVMIITLVAVIIIFVMMEPSLFKRCLGFFRNMLDVFRKKRLITKYKSGDMTSILKIKEPIHPPDVVGKKITNQDVLDVNLSLLHYSLMIEKKEPTWENKIRKLVFTSAFANPILGWSKDCVLPKELLEALLADKEALTVVSLRFPDCPAVIYHMAKEIDSLPQNTTKEKARNKNYG